MKLLQPYDRTPHKRPTKGEEMEYILEDKYNTYYVYSQYIASFLRYIAYAYD